MSDRAASRRLGLILASITLLLWGALPVVLKLLLRSLDPFTITWYRFLLAGGMLIPVITTATASPRPSGSAARPWPWP